MSSSDHLETAAVGDTINGCHGNWCKQSVKLYNTHLFCEVSTADGYHVGRDSEAECPMTRLRVRVNTWEPQPEA